MAYPEVDRRRAMLLALASELDASPPVGQLLAAPNVHDLGAGAGLAPREAERTFMRLLDEGYLRATPQKDGRLYSLLMATGGFNTAFVTDLTDKGLRAIGALPPEDSVEGIVAALEDYLQRVDEEPAPPEEKERKRTAVKDVIKALRTTATEVGSKVLAELLKSGMGL